MNDMVKFNAQLNINMQHYKNVADKNLELHQYFRNAAQQQLSFNQAWTQNQAFTRQAYVGNMAAAAGFMGGTAIPNAAGYHREIDAMQSEQKKDWTGALIGAGMAVAGGVLVATGVGAPVGAAMIAGGGAAMAGSMSGGGGEEAA
jgi:hypothetical protein